MSFWSSLAGAATSLIPGVGPFIAPLVGGLVGSALSPGSPSGSNPTTGTPNQSGNGAVGQAKNYFTAALNGDQSTLQGLLGPNISTVLEQYDNAAKTAANLGPRGGGRTAVLADAPFKKAGAYGQALSGATTGAAGKLGELGIEQQKDANSLQLGQEGINVQQNKLQQGAYQYGQDQLSGVGKGLGSILTNILTGKKAGGGSGGTTWSNDSSVFSGDVD
jgi:hypothetical protein